MIFWVVDCPTQLVYVLIWNVFVFSTKYYIGVGFVGEGGKGVGD